MATTGTTSLEFRVGFRFHPTKEELVNHYLKKKIQGHDFHDVIPEMDICSCEPMDLPGSDDDEWFYFSRPNYKSKGKNRNRATKRGFWKITSREKVIKARKSKAVIGKKRTLTFYEGKVRSGQKTNWVMHEYYIPKTLLPNTATQRDFVLCHLKKKEESTDIGAADEVEPRTNDASDFGNSLALVHGAGGPEFFMQENTQPEEIPSRASTESPQSDVYFSSIPRGNSLLANAGSANCIETDDETELTEFVNSFLVDPFEEGTHATLNHSTVGEKLVAQEKHSIEDQDIRIVAVKQAGRGRVASSLFEGDNDVVFLSGEHAFSANKEASGHRNIDHFQLVCEEATSQMGSVEQQDSNLSLASFAREESSLNESSHIKTISVLTRVHFESMPSTIFATEESSSDESSNFDFIAESASEDHPQATSAGPSMTFATEESSLDESSHFDFISQCEQLQSGRTGPSMPQKNHHYILQADAGTHSGSKGWFNVCKTSLVIHRSYWPMVYLLMILITSTFLLYTLAGEFGSNGRESASLKPLLTFVKNVVIPVLVAIYCRERKHGILFSLLFSFCSYFLAHQICV